MNTRIGRITILALSAAIVFAVGGCERKSNEPAAPATPEPAMEHTADYDVAVAPLSAQFGGEILSLAVEGMTCNMCANAVGNAVIDVPGVRYARVSLAGERAWIEVDPAHAGVRDALIAALAAAGYQASLTTDDMAGEAEAG